MSSIYHLIGGAFAHGADFGSAPFAGHPMDRIRAAKYLKGALMAKMCWSDAEKDIRDYLQVHGYDAARIQQEVDRARPFLEPWLT
jgi:hypothetical protein